MVAKKPEKEPRSPDKKPSPRNMGILIQQLGLNMLMVGLLALLAILTWERFFNKGPSRLFPDASQASAGAIAQPAPSQDDQFPISLNPLVPAPPDPEGVFRKTNLLTIIPTRPRSDVITYTVQTGDTLFSIAKNFNVKAATLLWGNYEVLQDNPQFLKSKQVINILPTDGVYYQWKQGDSLQSVADTFNTDPKLILDYPGNRFDLTKVSMQSANIEPGTWVIVPGGTRPIKDWGPPSISRQNPASARAYGSGACSAVTSGAIGSGGFVWPSTEHSISGYSFDPGVHPGIDIAGQEGNPIYATDSGVIVYAGWSDYGYGNLIVIDHGNGWQSAYGHLSSIAVTCGQSVYQGGFIGAMGSTGNSSGPHLHFELSINGAKVNPMDYTR